MLFFISNVLKKLLMKFKLIKFKENLGGPCKYTLILQDDAIASKNFLNQIEKAIKTAKLDENRNWFAIKLFYPEFWSGWQNSAKDIFTLLSFGTIFGIIMAKMNLIWIDRWRFRKFRIDFFLFLYWTIMTIIFAKSIGKQNLITPFPTGIYPAKLGAVAVAQLYPSHVTGPLTEYLANYLLDNYSPEKTIKSIDLVIDEFVESKHLHFLLLEPNPFQHVGVYSTNLNKNQGSCDLLKVSSTFPESDLNLEEIF